jgi:2-octaprenyl-6-methoxyphenol hydroxylase
MKFDIIIIGGGMVGAAMACALRTHEFKVAMIDSTPLTPSDDHRLIALNYSSVSLLKNLNIWPSLVSHACAIDEVHVSHRNHFGTTRLIASELKLTALGYVVPAKYINSALYENLNQTTMIRPATLKTLTQDTESATITVETPQGMKQLTAKIIIGADGTHSTVRKLLNIDTKTTDYQQCALVTTTDLNRSHHHIAYERFIENGGAIAMLPLAEKQAATIWTDSTENIAKLLRLTDSEFLQQLQKQFGYRLGKLKNIGKRYQYPLQMIQTKENVKQRIILIGNTAHTLHPIAAQVIII